MGLSSLPLHWSSPLAHTHTHTHTRTRAHIHVHTHTHTCAHTYKHMHTQKCRVRCTYFTVALQSHILSQNPYTYSLSFLVLTWLVTLKRESQLFWYLVTVFMVASSFHPWILCVWDQSVKQWLHKIRAVHLDNGWIFCKNNNLKAVFLIAVLVCLHNGYSHHQQNNVFYWCVLSTRGC